MDTSICEVNRYSADQLGKELVFRLEKKREELVFGEKWIDVSEGSSVLI